MKGDCVTVSDNDVLIKVRNLEKKFNGVTALKSVNADIKKGEVVVMIGPSGSGKSTFLRCMNLLEIPTSGTITFNGVDITDKNVDINVHRQKMGMVFQHFNLFPHMTILKNMPVLCRQVQLSQAAFRRTETAYCHRKSIMYEAGCYAF